VKTWVSDRGSHLKNEVVRSFREKTRGLHHFTLAYCRLRNGTVERVCTELLRATRALPSEFKLPPEAWPYVLSMVQAGLNNAASVRMQGKCPKEVFLGLPPDSPLVSIKAEREGKVEILSLSEIRAAQLLKVQEVLRAVEDMHKEVGGLVSKSTQRAITAQNAKTQVRAHNFDMGDFVLSAVVSRNRKSKLSLQWTGPHRVTKCSSDYIFDVQDLLTGGTCEVHGTRLKFYRNKGLEEDNELHEHLAYQQGELFAVERFTDIREHEGVL
jgi:hypothetical protein